MAVVYQIIDLVISQNTGQFIQLYNTSKIYEITWTVKSTTQRIKFFFLCMKAEMYVGPQVKLWVSVT